jgi:mannose/cellobiose epimerase-like protein (N-acyl-D-glucosamine 2-epimerase family)
MYPHLRRRFPHSTLVVLLAALGCAQKSAPPAPNPYAFNPPPAGGAPAELGATVWNDPGGAGGHLQQDLEPYWAMPEAKGSPEGNFPTWRTMTGALATNTARKPRMLGRQTYGYAIEYLLTGDPEKLALAKAGTRWILDHAWDGSVGGWFADLDAGGNPSGGGAKLTQDAAYTVMGPAAYFFVTRDPEAEARVEQTRQLLFDPATYFDSAGQRIRDGMNASLTAEAFLNGSGNDIVSQLDPITAFLLLVQPVRTAQADRDRMLANLQTLAVAIRDRQFSQGLFWGNVNALGVYRSFHSDYGHILKAHWALTQIDKRLDDRPFRDFLVSWTDATLTRALDATRGRWKKQPTSETSDEFGSDWWAFAEADQLAATLALHDPKWIPVVTDTSAHWRAEYVDTKNAVREIIPSITAAGSPVYNWPPTDTAKCNEWKSSFHSHEHALVMFLLGHYLAGTPAPLYFAFPAAEIEARAKASTPYTWQGKVAGWEDLGEIAGSGGLHQVRVTFSELR